MRWWSLLRERGTVRADMLAGLTGAVVVLPQGVAFATLAGMPPQYGLYSAMVPCIIAALFGSSRLMVTGPANAISLTTMALIAPLAVPMSAGYVELVLLLTLMVGAFQILLGWARAGRLVNLVPHAVVLGFTAGAALLIVNSQIAPFFGLNGPRTGVFQSLPSLWSRWAEINWSSVAVGVVTILASVLWRPLNRKVPAMLVAVLVGSAFAYWLAQMGSAIGLKGLPAEQFVRALPSAFPAFSVPSISLNALGSLLFPALIMTLLAVTEAMAIARAVAIKYKDRFDPNQEMIGQGLANIGGAFFSSYPASGSFNRSGVNLQSGALTPFSAISAAVFLMVLLSLVAPWAVHLPFPVIAALLFVVAWGLIDFEDIKRTWNEEPIDRATLVVTFLGTIALSLEWAIVLGIAVAAASRAYRQWRASRGVIQHTDDE
jgi:sulfate permease, SulP family